MARQEGWQRQRREETAGQTALPLACAAREGTWESEVGSREGRWQGRKQRLEGTWGQTGAAQARDHSNWAVLLPNAVSLIISLSPGNYFLFYLPSPRNVSPKGIRAISR